MLSFSGTTSYPEQDGVEGTGCAACGLLTVHQFEKVHKSEMRTMQVEEKQKESVFFFLWHCLKAKLYTTSFLVVLGTYFVFLVT